MAVRTVAIISPGEMGCAVGHVLKSNGLDIVASLSERSDLTKTRAKVAGFEDASTLEDLLGEADLVLSIVPPAAAVETARETATAMKATGHRPPYADCNAISPDNTRLAGKIITEAGAVFIDG
ncbi:MAG: NAD(P)-binding domain-containing protein [Nitrospinota bacterium]|jgi:3-hydroxyisobutyrate dehydrogenase-like beta-hydroxyacid dehydrogenase|nr:NAD(P)-binding domain-containing protein [Nitrospinota bacterium]MDP6366285.1 NAD(P)-binding domain-containing protein [Nitrospinota bacterium]MDP7371317.1 NAD(P)-binding domain-containing protein [Nitrospinota bacterium]MDP7662257.1 NAD(P)-binding domain-containing protein [Nitrospinota bacterium]|tara:strand:- start:22 stop:390 length:369 start_codon:yes stop_codon:yes gene_type:complete